LTGVLLSGIEINFADFFLAALSGCGNLIKPETV
jgi:hypothetical protein